MLFFCYNLQNIKFSKKFQITSKRDLHNNGEEESPKVSLQDKDFILDCLCWHNEYRARHSATALTVSPGVGSFYMQMTNFTFKSINESFAMVKYFGTFGVIWRFRFQIKNTAILFGSSSSQYLPFQYWQGWINFDVIAIWL